MTRRGLGDYVGSAMDLDRAFLLDARYSWVFKTGGAPGAADFDKGLAQLGLALAEFFQHANLAIGLDQRPAAALDLGGQRLPLPGDIRLPCPRGLFVALGLDQTVDVHRARRDF